MYTSYQDDEHLFDALRAGADGYLLKSDTEPDMVDEILTDVRAGKPPMSGAIARRCLDAFRHHKEDTEIELLTPRQKEVLELVGAGLPNAEIAEQLGLSVFTVKDHIKAIYESWV